MGTDLHILIVPKKIKSTQPFVLVGKKEVGWWYRHGHIYIENDFEGNRTHRLRLQPHCAPSAKEWFYCRQEEAVSQGVLEAMRPSL